MSSQGGAIDWLAGPVIGRRYAPSTALPDQCPHSAEADVRQGGSPGLAPLRRADGFLECRFTGLDRKIAAAPQHLSGTSLFCVLSFLVCMLEHRFQFFFEGSRRNSELVKSRPAVRGRRVDLHKLNLIARERRVRQELSEAG